MLGRTRGLVRIATKQAVNSLVAGKVSARAECSISSVHMAVASRRWVPLAGAILASVLRLVTEENDHDRDNDSAPVCVFRGCYPRFTLCHALTIRAAPWSRPCHEPNVNSVCLAAPSRSFATPSISAQAVKQLRDKTGSPMMDCKRALEEVGCAANLHAIVA